MIHQPMGGVSGQAADIEIMTKEILTLREQIYDILGKHTGQTIKKIQKDADRNYFMSAEEGMAYGIVDEVLSKPESED